MMISPDWYYEDNLKGKDEEQINKKIRGLKNEIGKLKSIMERPDYCEATSICPTEATRLCCTRWYLERAKKALAEIGGTYTPSKKELCVSKFDDSIPSINKIVFTIGEIFDGYETKTITFENGLLNIDISSLSIIENSKSNVDDNDKYTKDVFLMNVTELHLGEWNSNYVCYEITDGTHWELNIEFSNGHKPFKSSGSNTYPYNFNEFKNLIGIGENI